MTAMPDIMTVEVDPSAQTRDLCPAVLVDLRPRNVRQFVGETAGAVLARGVGMVLDRQASLASWMSVQMAAISKAVSGNADAREYMTTEEAAAYMRKSASWLVKRNDIPYVKGVPNIYRKSDLDSWFERSKFRPSL